MTTSVINAKFRTFMAIKNIIFDLGGVIIDIDYNRSINAFRDLGAANFEAVYITKANKIHCLMTTIPAKYALMNSVVGLN